VTKDILEELIKAEGWEYRNILKGGRRSNLPSLLNTIYFTLLTLWRLFIYTLGKKYDYFISDDLLSVIGRLRGIPSYHFQDDDLQVVPESKYLLSTCTGVFAPEVTDLGVFNQKKISYAGYHEWAYVHPNYFAPSREVVQRYFPSIGRFFVVRLVALTATHDLGKKGITNEELLRLIALLETKGEVLITAERPLPSEFEKYRIKIDPRDILHFLAFAEMFIGDSQTMCTEAALLGTPSLRYNSFVGKISTMNEIENEYKLSFGFLPGNFNGLTDKVQELLAADDKNPFAEARKRIEKDKTDVNQIFYEYFTK
jgi:predicted glycosyltransferase